MGSGSRNGSAMGEVQRGGRSGRPRDDGARMSPPRRDRGIRAFRFWRRDIGAEVDDEIAFHVEARSEELIAGGISDAEARSRALAEFGDVDRARRTL